MVYILNSLISIPHVCIPIYLGNNYLHAWSFSNNIFQNNNSVTDFYDMMSKISMTWLPYIFSQLYPKIIRFTFGTLVPVLQVFSAYFGPRSILGSERKKFGMNRIFMNPKIYQHILRATRRTVLQGTLYYKTHALILIKKNLFRCIIRGINTIRHN